MSAEDFRNLSKVPAGVRSPSKGKAQFALGRLPAGQMNKTEASFERDVLLPGRVDGTVLWYAFEVIKLRLAPNTHLSVDFAVLYDDEILTMIDVKGSPHMIEEDARAKTKIAAALVPFRFRFAWPTEAGWQYEDVGT